jgi:asparagine synthase (glutamine-hydrolysing)
MCGIAGIASHDSSGAIVAQAERMLARLAHRGPDDSGLFAFAPEEQLAFTIDRHGHRESLAVPPRGSGASVVLGNRRLAIIDLSSAGHQPMLSADARYAIVVNGEIYNFLELRQELEARGRRFGSRSDTEVLLVAFEEWGTACLPRLVGMFALAILDCTERRLFLARDPFGMKPLYYVTRPRMIAFASEIPPLLSLLDGRPRADLQLVYDYLDSAMTDRGDGTMFADVRALPSAHYAVVDLEHPDAISPVAYWQPDFEQTLDLSFTQAAERLRTLLFESVALLLRSDVRVGTLLSGGMDSSSLVMAMRHIGGPGLQIDTFSYIGEQGAVSEERWIDEVNAAAGATPHKVHLTPEDWTADADHLIESQNEPFESRDLCAAPRVSSRGRSGGQSDPRRSGGRRAAGGLSNALGYPPHRVARTRPSRGGGSHAPEHRPRTPAKRPFGAPLDAAGTQRGPSGQPADDPPQRSRKGASTMGERSMEWSPRRAATTGVAAGRTQGPAIPPDALARCTTGHAPGPPPLRRSQRDGPFSRESIALPDAAAGGLLPVATRGLPRRSRCDQ